MAGERPGVEKLFFLKRRHSVRQIPMLLDALPPIGQAIDRTLQVRVADRVDDGDGARIIARRKRKRRAAIAGG
jgi:hypothetical protein